VDLRAGLEAVAKKFPSLPPREIEHRVKIRQRQLLKMSVFIQF